MSSNSADHEPPHHGPIERRLSGLISTRSQGIQMRWIIVSVMLAILAPAAIVRAQEVRYFDVPQGDRPHDVAPAPDGSVWYTGQRTGVLGRLDPKTGAVERVQLGNGSAPHGVIIGPDGAA